MLATTDEVSKPYFALLLHVKNMILREAEDEFTKGQQAERVAHVSLSRGMPSTSQLDGLAKVVESIKQSLKKMEKIMEEMIGLFKTVEEKIDKKFEELYVNLNNIVEEIKRKQPISSGAQKTNEYMGAKSFEKHLDKVEEGKEEEDKGEDEGEDLSMEPMYQKGLGKKDDDEGRGGVARSGSQGFEGSASRQPTSTKS